MCIHRECILNEIKQTSSMSRSYQSMKLYFKLGLGRCWVLSITDEINLRLHTLRRMLRCLGLYLGKNESRTIDVVSFLNDQLEGHWRLQGWVAPSRLISSRTCCRPKYSKTSALRFTKKVQVSDFYVHHFKIETFNGRTWQFHVRTR